MARATWPSCVRASELQAIERQRQRQRQRRDRQRGRERERARGRVPWR